MKKMSEVFELPLSQEFGVVTESDGNWCARFNVASEAYHAAHAINHVDALADALESVLNTSRGTSGRIIIEIDDEQKLVATLKAYRGEA